MPRNRRMTVVLCVLALSGASYLAATSSVDARHAKHRSVKHKAAKKQKNKEVAKEEAPTARTPVDKQDCIGVSQAFYSQAKSRSRQTKQSIPREFERVISNLDQFCGEEEFEKARVTINWMSTCLENFTRDQQEYCSRDKRYFCALDPQADGCLQTQSEAR
jgi:hypothetical protein